MGYYRPFSEVGAPKDMIFTTSSMQADLLHQVLVGISLHALAVGAQGQLVAFPGEG